MHAQTMLTDHTFDHYALANGLRTAAPGMLTFLVAAGLGAWVQLPGASSQWSLLDGGKWRLVAGAVILILVWVFMAVDVRDLVSIEHPLLADGRGLVYTKFVLALAIGS